MANSFLLLVDGSSYLLLNNGTDKLIIGGTDDTTGGGYVYHTPNQIKKKIEHVEMQVKAVSQTITNLRNESYAKELAALQKQDESVMAALDAEIAKNQQLMALERELLARLLNQLELLRIRRNTMLIMAMSNPFGTTRMN